MEICDRLSYRPVREGDVAVLAPIMKRAFDEDSQLHLGKDGGRPERRELDARHYGLSVCVHI